MLVKSKLECGLDYRQTPCFQPLHETSSYYCKEHEIKRTRFGHDEFTSCHDAVFSLFCKYVQDSHTSLTIIQQPYIHLWSLRSSTHVIERSTNYTPPTVSQLSHHLLLWTCLNLPPQPLSLQSRSFCHVSSVSNLMSGTPVTYAICTIYELYHGAHACYTLNSLQFGAIRFPFGTHSAHKPPSLFMSPLAEHMDKRRCRAWWCFIFQMVRDKKRAMGHLNEGDPYWLLRARTSEVSLTGLNGHANDSNGSFIIHVNASPADYHLPCIKALLIVKKRDAMAEATAWHCW